MASKGQKAAYESGRRLLNRKGLLELAWLAKPDSTSAVL